MGVPSGVIKKWRRLEYPPYTSLMGTINLYIKLHMLHLVREFPITMIDYHRANPYEWIDDHPGIYGNT